MLTASNFETLDETIPTDGEQAPEAVNAGGTVVGYYGDEGSGNSYGYVESGGNFVTINDPQGAEGTAAYGINDSGTIAGSYVNANYEYEGFIDVSGAFTTVDVPSAADTTIEKINDSGTIAGYYVPDNNLGAYYGFIESGGNFTTIQDPNGPDQTFVLGINNDGEVVGNYYDSNDNSHGFVYQNGVYTTVDDPDGANGTELEGVNDSGLVVGFYIDANFVLHGFAEYNGTFITVDDPNTASAGSGDELTGVNDSGEAVGQYTDSSYNLNGFTVDLLCFLHGVRILTPAGPVAVEELHIGDTVVTRFGGIQPIKWLGRQRYAPEFLRNNPEKWPVCIQAGALADGMPARDLHVSAGHSLLLGDVLVPAFRLVNGVTITQSRPEAALHYVQIELATHDCVIAEGTWAETFADAPGLRARFHNAAEFYALYPDAAPAEALALCAPRPERGPKLAAALLPVVARAGVAPGPLEGWVERAEDWRIEGWARDLAHPHLPVRLEILAADQVIGTVLACEFRADLARAGKGNGRCAFRFVPPMRLTPEVLAGLVIRRATDGAPLPGTERFRRVA